MVKKINEVYKCSVCGNIVEVVFVGGGVLVCCGKEMILQEENSVDASLEKHVPVVEIDGNIASVKIGSVPHPMEDAHYIEWIEVLADGISYKKFLKPGDAPEAQFDLPDGTADITARAYCNLHGLWKK
ncbi:MAG: desulfoferrodoxin [Candidatus Buchananbacteria bacterium]|jgi:superoxide reductase